ncbi:MAG: tRNA pseudouridine(38-40) synthase TruA [Acidobacteria bacterium]|nr:tRNA pseudouridine(38-40) synthase TruA [Acidobacteriota bacterium]
MNQDCLHNADTSILRRTPVPTWKLIIEYDGSRYSGWQEQINARTVAGEIRQAAEKLFSGRIELMGAGRTDAGVHAAGQVAHLRAETRRPVATQELMRRLNEETPFDIAVLEVHEAPPGFHARHDAVARSYVYQFATRKTAFSKKYVWWIKDKLNIARMAEAAKLIEGRHDFTCFRAEDPTKPDDSPIVVVESCEIEEQPDTGMILFRIRASHFVWRMVRRLAGVIAKVGLGEVTVAQFAKLLDGKPDAHLDVAAWTAPSSGLFLEGVTYRSETRRRPPPPRRAAH